MTDHSFTITRKFEATPSELFDAWTEPEQYTAWIAAAPWSPGEYDMDVRPDGKFHVETIAPDGSKFTFIGHYTDIVQNQKVACRTDMAGPDGRKYMDQAGLVVTFQEVEPGVTEQILMCDNIANDESVQQFKEGWESGGLMDLERFLAAKKRQP